MAFQLPRHPEAFSKVRQKRPRQEATDHLRWLRSLPCAVTGKRPVEAAHIRFADAASGKREAGTSAKPDDKWAVPLHPEKHRDQHQTGDERLWWSRFGIDPIVLAAKLWAASGDDEAGEAIIASANAAARTFLGCTPVSR